MSINRIDYCQFTLSTQTNYTMTHFADHSKGFSHDAVNRLLRRDKLTGQIIWEHVKGDIIASPRGCLIFDDSVLDKNHSHSIELVRRQYSGNAHGLIKGIGMVNCLYVNPDTGQYWIVDYRISNHVSEMLDACIVNKGLAFTHVLFDSGYATKDLTLFVESMQKCYYCKINKITSRIKIPLLSGLTQTNKLISIPVLF